MLDPLGAGAALNAEVLRTTEAAVDILTLYSYSVKTYPSCYRVTVSSVVFLLWTTVYFMKVGRIAGSNTRNSDD